VDAGSVQEEPVAATTALKTDTLPTSLVATVEVGVTAAVEDITMSNGSAGGWKSGASSSWWWLEIWHIPVWYKLQLVLANSEGGNYTFFSSNWRETHSNWDSPVQNGIVRFKMG
jgi:hypothetical protein